MMINSVVSPKSYLTELSSMLKTNSGQQTIEAEYGKSGGDDKNGKDESVNVTTEVLSDGSVLMVVRKGNEIVSETKTPPPASQEKSESTKKHPGTNILDLADANSKFDKFNDTSASNATASGYLFDTDI